MASLVLDSWALMAFFNNEPCAGEVEKLVLQASRGTHRLLICAVNWGEIYYSIMRKISQAAAEKKAVEIAALPIEIMPVGENLELTKQAAVFKATRKMAYADCFAAALAKIENAALVTGDAEFHEVERDVNIFWLK